MINGLIMTYIHLIIPRYILLRGKMQFRFFKDRIIFFSKFPDIDHFFFKFLEARGKLVNTKFLVILFSHIE